jgi:ESCRT-I complex subunit TSG101
VYADVDAALVAHDRLRPKTDAYSLYFLPPEKILPSTHLSSKAYDDGRVKHLLCVHGLLPITFRGVAYNIPIACWIPLEFPKEPPLAYVVPTGDMLIRRSNNVDVSGLCQIEYVRQWTAKPEARDRIASTHSLRQEP